MEPSRRGVESLSSAGRFTLGKQSSLAPGAAVDLMAGESGGGDDVPEEIDRHFLLMHMTNEGDVGGIEELLESGVDVNFRDIDGRTALHVAACQGRVAVVECLLRKGAVVDPKDRWGSTPLGDAIHYHNYDAIKLLEKHGAKLPMPPMYVKNALQIPEYEINPRELDFSRSVDITKGTFRTAKWRGIEVAVKTLGEHIGADDKKVRAFRDELALLQQIRHPNVVQFLGAVTQSSPMMIVTEYLPKGDFRAYLKRKGALKLSTSVRFALDIARGLNYLHEHRPEAIIHRDLEPTNILLDDSGHLKVADFGVSKLLKVANGVADDKPLPSQDTACRYAAPEVFLNEECGTGVDVFSFALILQEMIEGCPPFSNFQDHEVPKLYISKDRPPFNGSVKLYRYGIKGLIEQCWSDNPANRPTFREVIYRLSSVQKHIARKRHWKDLFERQIYLQDVMELVSDAFPLLLNRSFPCNVSRTLKLCGKRIISKSEAIPPARLFHQIPYSKTLVDRASVQAVVIRLLAHHLHTWLSGVCQFSNTKRVVDINERLSSELK